ncbi:MAG: hypothetical protein M1828_000833 [Chrysothrix sp. TS-e1954]|nr:MAG: hypothetical protein M1828_000833 [Chrysothrix sp. TS-e1954]
MKFYDSSFTHDYSFPTVTLAYFLRYPNPYSTHVLSTDVISRHFDPSTSRLYTARLHLKRSKVPPILLKLLPRSLLGASAADTGSSQSYILEQSVVDIKEGVMVTESRNMEFTGVLAVAERQLYRRPGVDLGRYFRDFRPMSRFGLVGPEFYSGAVRSSAATVDDETEVTTRVEIRSRLGQAREHLRKKFAAAKAESGDSAASEEEDTQPQKMGFFRSWGTSSIQKTIEAVGMRRTERAVPKSKDGMNVVLARLRTGGLVAVFEGMRRDREGMTES